MIDYEPSQMASLAVLEGIQSSNSETCTSNHLMGPEVRLPESSGNRLQHESIRLNFLGKQSPLDLIQQVRDLSKQLDELGQLTELCLPATSSNPCSCHQPAINHEPSRVVRPADHPEPPQCCQKCADVCSMLRNHVDSSTSKHQMDWMKRRQSILQEQVNQLDSKLSSIQYRLKPDAKTARIERDIDNHVRQRNERNPADAVPRSIVKKPIRAALSKEASKSIDSRDKQPLKPFLCGKFNRPQTHCLRSKSPSSQLADSQTSSSISNDPEKTLAELATKLSVSQADLNSNPADVDISSHREDGQAVEEALEIKRLAAEIREMRTELQGQLDALQKYITIESTMKENRATHELSGVNEPENEYPVRIGSHFPTVRQAMERVYTRLTKPDDEHTHFDPDQIIAKAESMLSIVDQRRLHMETDWNEWERRRRERSIFGWLDVLNADTSSAEKTRIRALINESISKAPPPKKVSRQEQISTRLSRAPARGARPNKEIGKTSSHPVKVKAKRLSTLTSLWSDHGQAESRWTQSPRTNRVTTYRIRSKSSADPKVVHFRNRTTPTVPSSHPLPSASAGIIPLGHYQCSAATHQRSRITFSQMDNDKDLKSSVTQLLQHDGSTTYRQGVGLEYTRPPTTTRGVPLPTSTLTSDLNDQLLNRLLAQVADLMTRSSANTPTIFPSEGDLRELIENVLLERVEAMRVRQPSPTNRSLSPVRDRLPTPISSPERSTTVSPLRMHHQQPTPPMSDTSSRTSPIRTGVSPFQTLDAPIPMETPSISIEESKSFIQSEPSTRRRHRTPSPSIRTSIKTDIPICPLPTLTEVVKPTDRSIQTCIKPQSPVSENYNVTNVDNLLWLDDGAESSSAIDQQFSLTLPDTFSEGMWLIDRSEGEVLPYTQALHVATTMEPLTPNGLSTLSHDPFEQDTPISVCDTNTEEHMTDTAKHDHHSIGEIFPSQNPIGHGGKNNPLTNPLLNTLAMQQAGLLDPSKLPVRMRQLVDTASNKLNPTSQRLRPTTMDWLSGLSTEPNAVHTTPPLSPGEVVVNSRCPINNATPLSNIRPTQMEWLQNLAALTSISRTVSRQARSLSETEPRCSPSGNAQHDIIPDSDATTIDDVAYADEEDDGSVKGQIQSDDQHASISFGAAELPFQSVSFSGESDSTLGETKSN